MRERIREKLYSVPSRIRRLIGLVLAACAALAVCWVAFELPWVGVLEWRLSDRWAQTGRGRPESATVAVIGIDEDFLNQYGWPLQKDIYGDLIAYLEEMGVKAIGFDLLFADDLQSCGKQDSVFREIVALTPNVVLSCGIQNDGLVDRGVAGRLGRIPERFAVGSANTRAVTAAGAILPYPALLDRTPHLGFFNQARPFTDGVDRTMPLIVSQDSLRFPSLALVSCAVALGLSERDAHVRDGRMNLGPVWVAVDPDAYLYVNFTDSIPVFPLSRIRESHRDWLLGKQPSIGRSQLGGRIVLVGNTALSLGDYGISPLSSRTSLGRTPNVVLHAQAASTILNGAGLRTHGKALAPALSLALVLAAVLLFLFLPAQVALACSILLFALCLGASRALYLQGHIVPVLQAIVSGGLFCLLGYVVVYLEKEIDRKYLHALFGRYLSPHVIEDMYRKRVRPSLGGEEVYATAFFTDIEEFAAFSEPLSPQRIVASLNEYFTSMTGILLECGGTLDKFIGDAMVAFFGAPYASHDHARNACVAAVKMQEALARLRDAWRTSPHMPASASELRMRIGINTGRFVTGNIGCDKRMNYTMIGDAVNVASRLESAGKQYGVYTVVGEDTAQAVKHDFLLRKLDRIAVKGRQGGVNIYQLMGIPREDDSRSRELIDTYEHALEGYFGQEFAQARQLFAQAAVLERYPEAKNPSRVMLDRVEHLIRISPEGWDGVYRLTSK